MSKQVLKFGKNKAYQSLKEPFKTETILILINFVWIESSLSRNKKIIELNTVSLSLFNIVFSYI